MFFLNKVNVSIMIELAPCYDLGLLDQPSNAWLTLECAAGYLKLHIHIITKLHMMQHQYL